MTERKTKKVVIRVKYSGETLKYERESPKRDVYIGNDWCLFDVSADDLLNSSQPVSFYKDLLYRSNGLVHSETCATYGDGNVMLAKDIAKLIKFRHKDLEDKSIKPKKCERKKELTFHHTYYEDALSIKVEVTSYDEKGEIIRKEYCTITPPKCEDKQNI